MVSINDRLGAFLFVAADVLPLSDRARVLGDAAESIGNAREDAIGRNIPSLTDEWISELIDAGLEEADEMERIREEMGLPPSGAFADTDEPF